MLDSTSSLAENGLMPFKNDAGCQAMANAVNLALM